jgi:hypothetical protein
MSKLSQIWRPWILALTIAIGFAVVWGILAAVSAVFVEGSLRSHRPVRTVEILADGTPVIFTYWSDDRQPPTYETLDGKLAFEGMRQDVPPPAARVQEPLRPNMWPFRLTWDRRVIAFTDRGGGSVHRWYLIHDGHRDGSAYFEGYEWRTKQLIGFVGRNGFQRTKPAAEDRFSISNRRFATYSGGIVNLDSRSEYGREASSPYSPCTVFLLSGDDLLVVDLQQRTVKVLCEASGTVSVSNLSLRILSDGRVLPKGGPSEEEGSNAAVSPGKTVYSGLALVLRTKKTIQLLDLQGKELLRYVIPESLQNEDGVAYFLSDSEVLFSENHWSRRERTRTDRLTWFDKQGRVQKQESVVLASSYSILMNKRTGGLALPVPALWTLRALVTDPRDFLRTQECLGYSSAVAMAIADLWPALLTTSLTSAFLAWLCYRRQKRYAQPWTRLWVVTVFLFGLPGYIGYLTYRRWPPLETCPNCTADAPRDRETCYLCGEEFPRPALKGTEVFA